MQTALSAVTE